MNIPWEALEGLFVYIVASTLGFVWWMATITVKLDSSLVKLKEMNDNNLLYARKEDIARELGVIERQQEALWAKYDKLKERLDMNGTK